ncbi:MAG TPA: ABC transporter ATP-binding protein [Gemmatimonadales bacterium]|nr:ABC transporter ATP-binding protein [Gemmatimonadales bacterium]
MSPLLEIHNLRVSFPTPTGTVHPVDGVSLSIDRGEVLALVGESGSGKSLTGLSLLRLVPKPGAIESGSQLLLEGTDLLGLSTEALRQVRGRRIAMIFQDPVSSLNPVLRIGDQITETILAHLPVSKAEAAQRAVALLAEVGIADPVARCRTYPHQMSGGMAQRVMIAIALAAEPELLIADEPTTALDVTVQAQILELLDTLRRKRGMAILLISHDLGVVAGRADRVAVSYAGRIVEQAPTERLFAAPAHPYTRGLFASAPRLHGPRERLLPIKGSVPSPGSWPTGCRFRNRCPQVMPVCAEEPPVRSPAPSHASRCWLES